jgi:hypothetical protein
MGSGEGSDKPGAGDAWPYSMFLTGNSGHELKGWLEAGCGVRLLALDTGGLELRLAAAQGRLPRSALLTAAQSTNLPIYHSTNLPIYLPSPAWDLLGGPRLKSPLGWILRPGPASPAGLRAFLDSGCRLSSELRAPKYTAGERLHIAAVQAIPAALTLAAVLSGAGPAALGGAALLLLGALLLAALAQPWLAGAGGRAGGYLRARQGLLRLSALAGLSALVAGGAALALGLPPGAALCWGAATALLAAWQAYAVLRRTTVFKRAKNSSSTGEPGERKSGADLH